MTEQVVALAGSTSRFIVSTKGAFTGLECPAVVDGFYQREQLTNDATFKLSNDGKAISAVRTGPAWNGGSTMMSVLHTVCCMLCAL